MTRLAAATVGLLACVGAKATDLSYDFAELRWVRTELGAADGDGIRAGGSYQVVGNWLVVGDFNVLDVGGDVDRTTVTVGAGYLHRHSNLLDFVGYVRLVRSNIDTPFGDDEENGYLLSAGTRANPLERVELRAFLNYVDAGDRDTFVEVGGDYYFDSSLSAGATLELGDADTLTLGVRWFFGR